VFDVPRRRLRRRRRGVVIPIAVIALIIFSVLGVFIMWSGTSDYSQSAQAYYGLKADLIARSIHAEAQAVMYEVFVSPMKMDGTNFDPSGAMSQAVQQIAQQKREQLLEAIRQNGSGNLGELSYRIDLLQEGLLPLSSQVALSSGVEIKTAQIRFYGFRRMQYTDQKYWLSDDVYYADPHKLLDDDNKVKAAEDYIGYYMIWVRTACGVRRMGPMAFHRIRREHFYNHDLKLVNVSPVGREFALFSHQPTKESDEYWRKDLNEGGGLKIFGYRWGRIFVQGPFVVDIEGFSDGSGGISPYKHEDDNGKPKLANTFPAYESAGTAGNRDDWWGWGMLPPLRCCTLYRILHLDPARPDNASGWVRGELMAAIDDVNPVTLTWDSISAAFGTKDPAPFISDSKHPVVTYLCAARDVDDENNYFSIIGDPREGPDKHQFVLFRGIKGRYREETIEGKTSQKFVAEEPFWASQGWDYLDTPDENAVTNPEDAQFAILPEGHLAGRYNVARFSIEGDWWRVVHNWATKKYKVEINKDIDKPENNLFALGLRWEWRHQEKWLETLTRSLSQMLYVSLIVVGLGAAGFLTVVTGGLATPAMFLALTGAWAGTAVLDNYLWSTDNFNIVDQSPDNEGAKRAWATNYRPLYHGAIRRYRKLGNITSRDKNTPLLLDGILLVDDLSTDEGFFYRGRGMVVSEGTNPKAGAEDRPTLHCPIVPATYTDQDLLAQIDLKAIADDKDDFLTLAYLRWDMNNTHLGNRQMIFDCTDAWSVAVASVVSEQGVRPADNKRIHIFGNLVCGYMNKSHIPESSTLYLRYNPRLFPEGESVQGGGGANAGLKSQVDPQFTSWQWYSFGCSRKLSGISEGLRNP